MSLRRLLGLSGRPRRSLSTAAASRPPHWVLVEQAARSAPAASVRLVEPPRVSHLVLPAHLAKTSAAPDPDSDVVQLLAGQVCSASADGLLLVVVYDTRVTAPRQGPNQVRKMTCIDPNHIPDTTRFICNPLTGQLSRLPDMRGGSKKLVCGRNMGVLTQVDRGHGPHDRFAVAVLKGDRMLRFLSETGKWDTALTTPCQPPLARTLLSDQGAFAFGGRLWWVDLTWGAISVDPFSDRPETQFVELPRGSVMPQRPVLVPVLLDMESSRAVSKRALGRYRRVGVSEGRLRYAEVLEREPFVLSSFVLDDDACWTLEHRVVLSRLWADGGHPCLPLQEKTTPHIAALDPLNDDVIYLTVGRHIVGVDMRMVEVIGSSLHQGSGLCVPCVLPPWLGSGRIPTAGRNGAVKNKTLADVLVRSDRQQKT